MREGSPSRVGLVLLLATATMLAGPTAAEGGRGTAVNLGADRGDTVDLEMSKMASKAYHKWSKRHLSTQEGVIRGDKTSEKPFLGENNGEKEMSKEEVKAKEAADDMESLTLLLRDVSAIAHGTISDGTISDGTTSISYQLGLGEQAQDEADAQASNVTSTNLRDPVEWHQLTLTDLDDANTNLEQAKKHRDEVYANTTNSGTEMGQGQDLREGLDNTNSSDGIRDPEAAAALKAEEDAAASQQVAEQVADDLQAAEEIKAAADAKAEQNDGDSKQTTEAKAAEDAKKAESTTSTPDEMGEQAQQNLFAGAKTRMKAKRFAAEEAKKTKELAAEQAKAKASQAELRKNRAWSKANGAEYEFLSAKTELSTMKEKREEKQQGFISNALSKFQQQTGDAQEMGEHIQRAKQTDAQEGMGDPNAVTYSNAMQLHMMGSMQAKMAGRLQQAANGEISAARATRLPGHNLKLFDKSVFDRPEGSAQNDAEIASQMKADLVKTENVALNSKSRHSEVMSKATRATAEKIIEEQIAATMKAHEQKVKRGSKKASMEWRQKEAAKLSKHDSAVRMQSITDEKEMQRSRLIAQNAVYVHQLSMRLKTAVNDIEYKHLDQQKDKGVNPKMMKATNIYEELERQRNTLKEGHVHKKKEKSKEYLDWKRDYALQAHQRQTQRKLKKIHRQSVESAQALTVAQKRMNGLVSLVKSPKAAALTKLIVENQNLAGAKKRLKTQEMEESRELNQKHESKSSELRQKALFPPADLVAAVEEYRKKHALSRRTDNEGGRVSILVQNARDEARREATKMYEESRIWLDAAKQKMTKYSQYEKHGKYCKKLNRRYESMQIDVEKKDCMNSSLYAQACKRLKKMLKNMHLERADKC